MLDLPAQDAQQARPTCRAILLVPLATVEGGASRMLLVLSLVLASQCVLIFADLRANVVSLELSKPALAVLHSSGANKPAGVPASL